MVEELITVERLQTHADQLILGVETSIGVIAAINASSSVWLHHTLAAYIMAEDKSNCIFSPGQMPI